jgi:DNA-binding LacI/PurR family transcriptional regulator
MAATLRDVAGKAGVSVVTASRVLNRRESVRVGSRRRVLEAMKSLSYSPNLMAKGLSRSRIDMVSVYMGEFGNPFFGELASGLFDSFRRTPYELIICDSLRKTFELNRTLGVSGNMVVSLGVANLRRFARQSSALVAVNCSAGHLPGVHSVDIDYTGVYEDILDRAKSLGRRRVAFISPLLRRFPELKTGKFAFAENACRGIFGRKPEIFDSAEDAAKSARMGGAFDVFLCENDMIAARTYSLLATRGLKTPGDAVVVGCDGTLVLDGAWTIRTDIPRLASEAASMLMSLVTGGTNIISRRLIKAEALYEKN